MNNSRQRLVDTLNHCQPDRVCVDFGSTAVTGIHASTLSRLRKAVLGDEKFRVKVINPYSMLGEVDPELAKALEIDVAGIVDRVNGFGVENTGWKPITLFDGTEVLMPEHFCFTVDANGDWLAHPQGDTTAPPSARMPKGGYYFDAIIRQQPIDEDKLDPADNTEEFTLLGPQDLQYVSDATDTLSHEGFAVLARIPRAGFGDIAMVPAVWMKNPRGIRDVEEWYISTAARPDYILKVFQRQCEVALANIDKLIDVLGERIDVAFISGTDFGTQRGLMISKETYRQLYKPFHMQINALIHRRTKWKTMIHSCGGIYELLPDIIEAGFDILNPVQTSAEGMEPRRLKKDFGRSLVFWGGGVDTQKTLAFGSPDEVYRQVRKRIDIFNDGGGFVFNPVHNIQAMTPTENLLAMFRAIRDSR